MLNWSKKAYTDLELCKCHFNFIQMQQRQFSSQINKYLLGTNIAILATLKCLSILFLKSKYFVKQTQRCKTFVPAAVKAPLNPCHDM